MALIAHHASVKVIDRGVILPQIHSGKPDSRKDSEPPRTDGVARAGSASRQAPVGKPRGGVGAIFGATPVPGAPTPTGCPTLTIFFSSYVGWSFVCTIV